MITAKRLAYSLLQALLLQGASGAELDPDDPETDPTSPNYLAWMCHQVINAPEHPTVEENEKLHRWIGCIQGVLISSGQTIEERRAILQHERDRTRNIVKPLSSQ
jgi:hypothetical protein